MHALHDQNSLHMYILPSIVVFIFGLDPTTTAAAAAAADDDDDDDDDALLRDHWSSYEISAAGMYDAHVKVEHR